MLEQTRDRRRFILLFKTDRLTDRDSQFPCASPVFSPLFQLVQTVDTQRHNLHAELLGEQADAFQKRLHVPVK